MAHNHENCTAPQPGAICLNGVVFTFCDDSNCSNECCVEIGHCECLCHSGKECDCGFDWPRMEKQNA